MRYKLFGPTGLRVSELCLGTMTFGEDWGWGAPREESRRMLDTFAERGGNFLDTAINYTGGSSEAILGELLAGRRARFVVATKYSMNTSARDPNAGGNHRKNLVQSLETSLRKLKTDYIDLYWLHAWDYQTPVEEVMRALDDAVRAGKVLYVGISDTPAWIVAQANTLAELRGWTPFAGLQIEYSLIERTVERELIPMAQSFGMTVAAWSPLGGGVLSGKYGKGATPEDSKRSPMNAARLTEKNLAIAEEVKRIAQQAGHSPSQVALNWLSRQPNVIPILGARKLSQLEDNLASLDFRLSEDQLERLETVSRIEKGFPHEFLDRPFIRDLIFGETFELLDPR